MSNRQKAIFLDRDGVVNYRMVGDYVRKIEEFKFLPDFLDFFPKAIDAGYKLLLITNQQGVGKGFMTLSDLQKVMKYMQDKLNDRFGDNFLDIFYCTDLADSGSYYRKPNPGMLIDAINKWNVDIQQSWMIGDSPTDVTAGRNAGLKTILLGDYKPSEQVDADYIIKDLFKADEIIWKLKTLS